MSEYADGSVKHRGALRMSVVLAVAVMAASCLMALNMSDSAEAGDPVYYDCGTNAQAMYLDTTKTLYINGTGAMFDKSGIDYWGWSAYKNDITTVQVNDGITHLGGHAFSNMPNLTTVTLPGSLTSIGNGVFTRDYALTSIELPSSVTTIGDSAFNRCTSLSNISLPASVTAIGEQAFTQTPLKEFTFPSGVTLVSDFCFDSCTSLETVNLPSSLATISTAAFYKCTALKSIYIPDSVTTVSNVAFYDCTSLQYVRMSGSLDSLSTAAFSGIDFYDSMSAGSPMDKTIANLNGKTFASVDGKLTMVSRSLSPSDGGYDMSANATSIDVLASDIAFMKQNVNADSSMRFGFSLKDGASASFDSEAVKKLSSADATLSLRQRSAESLDDSARQKVGDNPVFEISFGDNKDFGNGKASFTAPYTLPSGKSADSLKVFILNDGKVSGPIDCTYSDGKVSFSASSLDGSNTSGGGFPILIVAVIAIVAAVGVVFFLFRDRIMPALMPKKGTE